MQRENIKGKHETFIVHKLKPFSAINYIAVYNKKNIYSRGILGPNDAEPKIPMNPKDKHVNVEEVKRIVYEVLTQKLNDLKRNNETLGVNLIFKLTGEVSDITFSLRENTLITAQEIEEIDKKLRGSIKATFTGRQYLQYPAISGPALPNIVF